MCQLDSKPPTSHACGACARSTRVARRGAARLRHGRHQRGTQRPRALHLIILQPSEPHCLQLPSGLPLLICCQLICSLACTCVLAPAAAASRRAGGHHARVSPIRRREAERAGARAEPVRQRRHVPHGVAGAAEHALYLHACTLVCRYGLQEFQDIKYVCMGLNYQSP